jgi:hypothetical protein
MSEGNSCWDGGKPSVFNTFASALWCADMMLRFAKMGWVGVNLHGGGNGFYTPIAGAPSTGLIKRPEYFDMQFAQLFAEATFLHTALDTEGPKIAIYALERNNQRQLVVFNKDVQPITLTVPSRTRSHAQTLTGPSIESEEGVSIKKIKVPRSRNIIVPPYTAIAYDIE